MLKFNSQELNFNSRELNISHRNADSKNRARRVGHKAEQQRKTAKKLENPEKLRGPTPT